MSDLSASGVGEAQPSSALCELGAAVRRLAREHGFDAHLTSRCTSAPW